MDELLKKNHTTYLHYFSVNCLQEIQIHIYRQTLEGAYQILFYKTLHPLYVDLSAEYSNWLQIYTFTFLYLNRNVYLCLMTWQLVTGQSFSKNQPCDVIFRNFFSTSSVFLFLRLFVHLMTAVLLTNKQKQTLIEEKIYYRKKIYRCKIFVYT